MGNSVFITKRPVKSGGTFYPAGTIVDDSAGIKLFRSKVREGKIVEVAEHNLDSIADYLELKKGHTGVREALKNALNPENSEEAKAAEAKAKAKADIEAKAKAKAEIEAKAKAKAEAKKAATDKE